MRFDRKLRDEGYVWTRRKEQLFLGRHKRLGRKFERDYPLFSDQLMPMPDTDVEAEKAARVERARRNVQLMRDLDATHWRAGRASYFACGPETRVRIMTEWRAWRGPAKPCYFIYVVEKHNGVGEARMRAMREREAEVRVKALPLLNSQGNFLWE